MKHLKEYNLFQEGIFNSEFDETVNSLFERIKNNFDADKISKDGDDGIMTYSYEIEETDSQLGYIKLDITRFQSMTPIIVPTSYTLKVDDAKIGCSYHLKLKIYNYLKSKYKESEISKFKSKYNL